MTLLNKVKNHIHFKSITAVFLALISCVYLYGAISAPTIQQGESNDFMMATLSLENRLSLFITAEDLEQAKEDYPEHFAYLSDSYYEVNNNSIGPDLAYRLRLRGLPDNAEEAKAADPVKYEEALNFRHCYYFSVYSFLCIPVHFLLKTLDLSDVSPSYSFAITNALLFSAALLTVFLKLKQTDKKKFFIILLLALNPAIFYISWPSYEICILSFIIISLTFFSNREFKKAALFLSVAGMMQPTIMIFGVVIIISYFVSIWLNEKCGSISAYIKAVIKNFGQTMLLAVCFLPSLIPFLYFKVQFNLWGLNVGGGTTDLIFSRALSYLIDLNYGILPYCGIILILAVVMFAVGIVKRNKDSLAYFVIIFGVLLGFSLMPHINCGMAGIARYNVFEIAFFIFYVVINYDRIFKNKHVIRIIDWAFGVSVLLTCAVVISYGAFACRVSDQSMTPIALTVLENCPAVYNPLYSTFITRTNHTGGGYTYESPVVYTDPDGYVRKALVTKETADQLLTLLMGDASQMQILQTKLDNLHFLSTYKYINFASDCTLVVKDKYGIIVEDNYAVDISYPEAKIVAAKDEKGELITITVNIKNNTQNVFSTEIGCYMSYHLYDSNGNLLGYDGIRSALTSIYPGETKAQNVIIEVPGDTGTYVVEVDMLREGIVWFSQKNLVPLRIDLEVA